MGIFIRCEWMTPSTFTTDARVAEVADVIRRICTEGPFSGRWFLQGRSRKEALSKSVDLDALSTRKKPWRRVSLIEDLAYYSLSMWDGRDDLEAASLSAEIYEPETKPNMLLISGPPVDSFRPRVPAWPDVLELARSLAAMLDGLSVVGTDELFGYARAHGMPHASFAAHAAFWEPDRSGESPLYAPLRTAGLAAPCSLVASTSWDEVVDPSRTPEASLLELMRLLAVP